MTDVAEAFELLSHYVRVPRYVVVDTPSVEWDAFPAVAKIASMEHKTEKGGVILGIRDREELKQAISRLLRIYPRVVVQEQISGVEAYLGGKEDPSFGPVISLGVGGIYLEVYDDVASRLVPLSASDVVDMVNELRGKEIFYGKRKRVNFDALVRTVLSFSRFLERYRPRIAEINPLIVNEEDAYAVDIRLFLD